VPLHALNTLDAEHMKRAVRWRVWRVRMLTLSTWLLLASAVLAAASGLATTPGRAINEHIGEGIGRWWGRSDEQVGVLVVVVALWLLLVVTRGIWRLWDRREASDFCSRESDINSTVVFGCLAALPSLLATWFVLWAVAR
jgi:hypothetical protein